MAKVILELFVVLNTSKTEAVLSGIYTAVMYQ